MSFEFKGGKAMQARLRKLEDRYHDRIKGALRVEAEIIMTRSKRDFVPVDLGTLRSSGHVQEPERSGKDVSVTLAFGGPAAPYALIQHEGDFHHKVGTRKYLERPLMEAIPELPERLAARLKVDR